MVLFDHWHLLGSSTSAEVTVHGRGGTHACTAGLKGLVLMSFSTNNTCASTHVNKVFHAWIQSAGILWARPPGITSAMSTTAEAKRKCRLTLIRSFSVPLWQAAKQRTQASHFSLTDAPRSRCPGHRWARASACSVLTGTANPPPRSRWPPQSACPPGSHTAAGVTQVGLTPGYNRRSICWHVVVSRL